jgi:Alpha/beta hydrolase family
MLFFLYVETYYRADFDTDTLVSQQASRIQQQGAFTIIRAPMTTKIGFIFYPGAKIEEAAYLPLLLALADTGITCVLVKMPFRLAVFAPNKADALFSLLPEILQWYIGGHSLGGAMASNYLQNTQHPIAGLILLGAYPINEVNIATLTLYGEHDGVINQDRLQAAANQYPIVGGNHANFGNYGSQKGDGLATITPAQQQAISVQLISQFILG